MIAELYTEGGFIMHPLLGCLILSLAISIEKIITLVKFKKDTQRILTSYKENEDLNVFNEFIRGPLEAIEKYSSGGKSVAKGNSYRYCQKLNKKLSSSTWMIGTVASSSPFIGLFGTVVGIIKSFGSISKAGKGGFAVVAADLSEALILFNFIKQRIKETMDSFNFQIEELIEEKYLEETK